MSGTKEGARKVAQALTARYGADYYSKLGQRGGLARVHKFGFQEDNDLARRAAQKSAEVRKAKKVVIEVQEGPKDNNEEALG